VISSLFYPYVAINSETGTVREKVAAEFVISSFRICLISGITPVNWLWNLFPGIICKDPSPGL
jgi:hypothetical protein